MLYILISQSKYVHLTIQTFNINTDVYVKEKFGIC